MMGWSCGTLQSKIRSGFVPARRWQSPHSLATSSPSALMSASPNAGRHAGQPTEFITSSALAISKFADERPREVDHLGVDRRIRDAEHLDVELVELPVAPLLGPFVPEHRPEEVDLRRGHGLLEAVLDERAHQARRGLGAQGDALAALVGERVHLLLDDVGRLAGALGEQFLALDDGRADFGVPVALEEAARHGLDALPALDLAGEDVVGSSDGWNHAVP